MADNTSYIQVIHRRGDDGTVISYLPGNIVDEELMRRCRRYIHIEAQDAATMERHSRIYKDIIAFLDKHMDEEITRTPLYPFTIVGIIHIFLPSLCD